MCHPCRGFLVILDPFSHPDRVGVGYVVTSLRDSHQRRISPPPVVVMDWHVLIVSRCTTGCNARSRQKSPCGNLDFRRYCSARLQTGTVDSSTCSSAAADERYRVRPPDTDSEAYLSRMPDLDAGLGAEVGRTNFGFSIVPVRRKLGGDAAAGDVAAWKIDGRMRRSSAWEKPIRPSA
jgi:hypothetical protein